MIAKRLSVCLLILFFAAPLAAQEPANGGTLDDLVTRLASKDPFVAFLAKKDFDAWADRVGDEALSRVQEMRFGATGRFAEALDEAIARLGGTPPPKPTEAQLLDGTLEKLAGNDVHAALEATEELDIWIEHAGPGARKQLESRRSNASTQRREGIDLALARLDRIDRVKALVESADADAKRAWRLLRGTVSSDPFQPRDSLAELRAWACAEPEKVRERLVGFREHINPEIAEQAVEFVRELDGVLKWLPLLKSFDTLQTPSTARHERMVVWRTKEVLIPTMPAEPKGAGTVRGWLVSGSTHGLQVCSMTGASGPGNSL